MKAPKGFLTADYWIQTIIGIPCAIFSLVIYGIILLLPLGIWQVISSLVLVFGYKDKKRIPHLIFTVIWFVVLALTIFINIESFALYLFYFILLPAGVAIWYYSITYNDYLLINGKSRNAEEMENILDMEL
ncbi:MAG: hypothetical protein ACI85O_001604 [Saprospiraceae bacterium]|jgi:hypothetical protein